MNRVVISERRPRRSVVLCLPELPEGAGPAVRWWLVDSDERPHGRDDDGWLAIVAEPGVHLIGLVPPALARIGFKVPADGSHTQQAETVARVEAVEASLGDPETLHAASMVSADQSRTVVTAVVANDAMLGWLGWAETQGATLDCVVPMASLLPLDDEWVRLAVGSQKIVGRRGMVIADEPGLADALLDGEPRVMDDADLGAALSRLAADPRPNLRSGRFARRRVMFDRSRLRAIGRLLVVLAAVTTLIALIQIVRLHQAARALDADTVRLARTVAGPSVTIDNAETAAAAKVGGSGGASPTIASLLQRMQQEPGLSVTALTYGRGTTTMTLSASSAESINRLIQALQRDGYRLTATPRSGADGASLADVTIQG